MPLRHRLLIIGCSLLSLRSAAQKQIIVLATGGFSGENYGYRFDQQENVLQRGYYYEYERYNDAIGLSYGLGLQLRIRRFAFEAGYSKIEMDLGVADGRFIKSNNIKADALSVYRGMVTKDTNYDAAKLYNSGYISFYYFMNSSRVFQPYVQVGAAVNYLDSKTTSASGSFDYEPTGEHTTLTADFERQYVSTFLESGLSWQLWHQFQSPMSFFIGLRYTNGGRMMSGNYSNTGGPSEYTDHVTATGNYLSLSIKIGYTFKASDLKPDRGRKTIKHKTKSKPKRAPLKSTFRLMEIRD